MRTLRVALAILCGVAYFAAANHCGLGAFVSSFQAQASECHSGNVADHPEKDSPSGHDDCQDTARCCSALRATPISKVEVGPNFSRIGLQSFDALSVPSKFFVASTFTATGLSPPLREQIPRACFYRIAFASHAPPVCLA